MSGRYNTSDKFATGIIMGNSFGPREVTYAEIDGQAIFQGDIVLGTVEELKASTQQSEYKWFSCAITNQYLWPHGILPYQIDSSLPNKERIKKAIEHWQDKTQIRFVERSALNESAFQNYVNFKPEMGCWATVGKRGTNGQSIGLTDGCGISDVIHEIGHTLGLWHEQSREDRDAYVTIMWDNIEEKAKGNFEQNIVDGDDIGPYDYTSLMHYHDHSFAIDGTKPTIVAKGGQSIAPSSGLTEGDILAIASLYPTWNRRPGWARDIGVGANGHVWVVGTSKVSGGYSIYQWTGNAWNEMSKGGVRIAVDPAGNPWIVDEDKNIWSYDGAVWHQVQGKAIDIGIGASGDVWVIGTDSFAGGNGIHRWTGTGWDTAQKGGVRIAVDPLGNPWIVDDAGKIWRYDGSTWVQMPGWGNDIGIGSDGTVWLIGTSVLPGLGNCIHKWTGFEWVRMDGGATQIAVGPTGMPWIVDEQNRIYERAAVAKRIWNLRPGLGRDIGVGAEGSVWLVGYDTTPGGCSIHHWTGSTWQRVPGGAVRIAVDSQGSPWIADDQLQIFRGQIPWHDLPGAAGDVGVGANGDAWVIGLSDAKVPGRRWGTIYRWEDTQGKWTFIQSPQEAKHIAVTPFGTCWMVTYDKEIWSYYGNAWKKMPGWGRDIAIGADGTVWVVGTTPMAGGYSIHRWLSHRNAWEQLPVIGGVRIAVDPKGFAWVVDNENKIWRYSGNVWRQVPGWARDIGIGANGDVWVIGHDQVDGGYSIHKWNGSGWDKAFGGGISISVGPNGEPWITDDRGRIRRGDPVGTVVKNFKWERMPGQARDIGTGAKGSVWVIGNVKTPEGFTLHFWNPSRGTDGGWEDAVGGGVRIAVNPLGNPWVVHENKEIWQFDGAAWRKLPGWANAIGVGQDGSAWIVGTEKGGRGGFFIYRWNGSDWEKMPGLAVEISVGPDGRPWVINGENRIFERM